MQFCMLLFLYLYAMADMLLRGDSMKHRIVWLGLIIGILITGCGTNEENDVKGTGKEETVVEKEIVPEKETLSAIGMTSGMEQTVETTATKDELAAEVLPFEELENLEFYFSSGAGGWRTVLMIEADGNFYGTFSDSDMGTTGEGYPGGTYYFCEFNGKFTEPVKVNDYTYAMQIEAMDYMQEEGTEEIIDGTLYCYSGAYGLEGAEEILVYAPGAPVAELPIEYKNWVRNVMVDPDAPELSFYGLYNVKEQNGFSSFAAVDPIEMWVEDAKERADVVMNSLLHDPLNQAELNVKAEELYQIWDGVLNQLWGEAKKRLPEAEFADLLQEQRAWIVEKEDEARKAGEEVEGGSMYGMVVNSRAARVTEERVYELYELLK